MKGIAFTAIYYHRCVCPPPGGFTVNFADLANLRYIPSSVYRWVNTIIHHVAESRCLQRESCWCMATFCIRLDIDWHPLSLARKRNQFLAKLPFLSFLCGTLWNARLSCGFAPLRTILPSTNRYDWFWFLVFWKRLQLACKTNPPQGVQRKKPWPNSSWRLDNCEPNIQKSPKVSLLLTNHLAGGLALAGSLEKFYETCGIPIYIGCGLMECLPLVTFCMSNANMVTAGGAGKPCMDTELCVVNPDAFRECWSCFNCTMLGF
jgi:hypothetical protein